MAARVDTGAPLCEVPPGIPVVYACLGASFFLESLVEADAERLEEANALIQQWFGAELKWTLNSSVVRVEPYRDDDLEFVSAYPTELRVPMTHAGDPDVHADEVLVAMDAHTEFGMFCHGGAEHNFASPYSYRFWSEICWMPRGEIFETCPVLRITVPLTWPKDDFREKVTAIASKLRLRWGVAGHTYSGYAIDFWSEVHNAIHAHARRFSGYDPAFYVSFMRRWFHELRTVSWLTMLGPAFVADLRAKNKVLESNRLVTVSQLGENVLLQAGDKPEEGDRNRLDLPKAYQRADEMVRPKRARSTVDFLEPWSEASTEEWLCRFEKRVH